MATTEEALRKALKEVFDGHRFIDFDWYGWEGRTRQALGLPVVAPSSTQRLRELLGITGADLSEIIRDAGDGDFGAAGRSPAAAARSPEDRS